MTTPNNRSIGACSSLQPSRRGLGFVKLPLFLILLMLIIVALCILAVELAKGVLHRYAGFDGLKENTKKNRLGTLVCEKWGGVKIMNVEMSFSVSPGENAPAIGNLRPQLCLLKTLLYIARLIKKGTKS
jgi:hypothetical protein